MPAGNSMLVNNSKLSSELLINAVKKVIGNNNMVSIKYLSSEISSILFKVLITVRKIISARTEKTNFCILSISCNASEYTTGVMNDNPYSVPELDFFTFCIIIPYYLLRWHDKSYH